MLSHNVVEYLKVKGWWFDHAPEEYENALLSLNINLDSAAACFYLHAEDGTVFRGKKNDIYQLCWFIINTNYQQNITSAHDTLGLAKEYIPLDSFEGGGGYFYNRETGEVLEFVLGDKNLTPQWSDFNTFIEDFFGL